jgi:hypothetical protein
LSAANTARPPLTAPASVIHELQPD